jgi:hypothetical protein
VDLYRDVFDDALARSLDAGASREVVRHCESRVASREEPEVIELKVSSYCSFGNCVEVGRSPEGTVLVRDTKDPHGGVMTFTDEE